MGLLEKALRFKKNINKQGKETLIDTIKGPAETDVIDVDRDILKLGDNDLVRVTGDGLLSNERAEIDEELGFDYQIVFEITKEIVTSKTESELYDSLLFSIMGHIGVSSNSIMVQDDENVHTWRIVESQGINIEDNSLTFDSFSGVLNELIKQKKICDLEDYKENPDYADDYFKFLSVDARVLVPVVYNDTVLAILLLGEKINEEPLSRHESLFLNAVLEFTSPVLKGFLERRSQQGEIESIDKKLEYIKDCDMFLEGISAESDRSNINILIQNKMRGLGIEKYAYFIKRDNKFVPLVAEQEDSLMLFEMNFSIPVDKNFINYISENVAPVIFDDLGKSRIVSEVFNKGQISQMDELSVFPFLMNSSLLGFAAIFRIADEQRKNEIDFKLKRLSMTLFSYLNNIINLDVLRNKYIDNVEALYARIEHELMNAKNLNIPVTVIYFSIKNYKRFFNMYGLEEIKDLMKTIEEQIRKRLSDGDFSFRFDRHKIYIILPGKDKKYAVPLANSIKNDTVKSLAKKEMELLFSFITVQYPEDGNNIYSLIEALQ